MTGHGHDDAGVDIRFSQIRDARVPEVMKAETFHGE